ncbi:hypothetical protein CcrColossus_gp224 [Caulobacter phage CcrColossus]|uniref:Uncharacterized protein n=1 Tax=Caulobacter phage CcrColossus TaxID=1211640 RepID=K4JRX5_9CAUD|nr:hypothetical protein CcrColossus_gp224 [Caulobacter phage CcrColossus]AFU88094.1 hypothetical protein CcrColossus_gp224 [Caulobacter phage CcrColossus]
MNAVEASGRDAHPLRLPRRGDKVQAALFLDENVNGTVQHYLGGRVTVLVPKDKNGHTKVTLDFKRMTWKPKSRVWVYWPQKVIQSASQVDKATLPISGLSPRFGEPALIDGQMGFISHLLGQPRAVFSGQALMNSLTGVLVSLKGMRAKVLIENLFYDESARIWVGRSLEAES